MHAPSFATGDAAQTSGAPVPPPQGFDPRALLNIFMRQLPLFGAVALVCFTLVVLFTLQATPTYTATSSVMLDTRKEEVVDVKAVLSGLSADSSVVDTEVEVLKSRQLAERVASALKLEEDPEFNEALRTEGGARRLVSWVKGLFGAAAPADAPKSEAEAQMARERIIDAVLSKLSVRRSGLTYIINVSYSSEDSAKAAKIANKFAELYLLEQLQAKFDATKQANTWLNERLAEMRQAVLSDEAAVQQFKIANNLMSASGTNLTEQEISNYNQSLAQSRAQVAEDEARLATAQRQLKSGSTGEDVGEAMTSPVVQRLRDQRGQVTRRLAELQSRYGPRHPEMLKAQGELSDIDNSIREEIGRIISNLEARVQVSRERAAAVSRSIGTARGALATNNRAMVRLNELERNAEASRTLYESYLARFKETSGQEGIQQSDARVVSRAQIPSKQSAPNVPLNLLVGLVIAAGAGFAAIVVAELLDAGVATASDVERKLDAAYLGSLPTLASVTGKTGESPVEHVVSKPLSSFSEALRNLRTSLLHARVGERVQVVAITSALPGEGKTTTAVTLARVAALQGTPAIVVDCDLRRRSLNRALKIQPDAGLLEVLSGRVMLDDALIRDEASGADFLTLTASQYTPRDVFGSAAMDNLIARLRERYDLIILDLPPVLAVSDARTLAAKADAVAFLARWRKTPRHAIDAAFRLLTSTSAFVAGVMLTQVDMRKQARYGYGDPGYYYGEYKKYYAN